MRYRCYRDSAVQSALSALTTILNARLGTWRSIDRVHVPSAFARQMLEAGPFAASQFVVFPNAAPDPGERTSPPSASDRILFVGRLSEEKGLDLILRAWSRRTPDALRLVVVGEGPASTRWMAEAIPGVEFRGWMEPGDVMALMLESRALVFPSRWFEGCPMVIVEALAAGLPVISHDLGAMTELLDFAAPRSLVRPGDEAGWDEAIGMLRDDGLVDGLGAESRAAYLSRHTPRIWTDSHVRLYEEALG
jgi:glycosyltransferase involved in cell wall biosynthesis